MILTLLPLAAALATMPVEAGDTSPPTGRFQIVVVPDGFVRLDTTSGAMMQCRDAGSGYACAAIDTGATVPTTPAIPRRDGTEGGLEDFDRALGLAEKAMKRFMDGVTNDRACSL